MCVHLWSLNALLEDIFVHSIFEAYYEIKTKGILESPGTQITMNMSLSELRELVMDREAWRAVIHGVAKSRTRLRD